MRILVVEDESRIADFLSRGLVSAGYAVDVAATGGAAIDMIHSTDYDLMILDLGLPDVDGLTVLQKIRNRKVSPPVLILSARDAVDDRVKGLEGGADDYLVKPFAFAEVVARMRALVRRGRATEARRLVSGDLDMDLAARRVTRAGRPIDLTLREYEILEYLLRHDGQVVSRDALARDVWKESARSVTLNNVIDVHMARLRRKLDIEGRSAIQTVRGVGFVLREGTL